MFRGLEPAAAARRPGVRPGHLREQPEGAPCRTQAPTSVSRPHAAAPGAPTRCPRPARPAGEPARMPVHPGLRRALLQTHRGPGRARPCPLVGGFPAATFPAATRHPDRAVWPTRPLLSGGVGRTSDVVDSEFGTPASERGPCAGWRPRRQAPREPGSPTTTPASAAPVAGLIGAEMSCRRHDGRDARRRRSAEVSLTEPTPAASGCATRMPRSAGRRTRPGRLAALYVPSRCRSSRLSTFPAAEVGISSTKWTSRSRL